MAKVVFTPWKKHSELLAVRSQFYPPPDYDGPDLRSRACATVGAWKLRGNLPHPVEATALLTDAILHDDAQKNSVFSIRATYSAAFCRFVTSLVDSKLHGLRRTMFQRATDLGLPASFVELRHEATHRELPSLTALRSSTQRSLEWLWEYYWVKTGPAGPLLSSGIVRIGPVGDAGEDGAESLYASFRAVLGQVVRENETSEPPQKKRKVQQRLSGVASQVVSICNSSKMASSALAHVMLRDEVLVPRGRRLGDSFAGVLSKWDMLLQMIAEAHPPFLVALAEGMVDALAFTRVEDIKSDPYCEGVYIWLDHILRSPEWSSSRHFLSYSYILAVCEGSPNHWTTQLYHSMDNQGNRLVSRVSEHGGFSIDGPSGNHESTTDLDDDDDLRALSKYGWEMEDAWESRPLGVA